MYSECIYVYTHIRRRHWSLLRILSPFIVLRGRCRRLQNAAYTSREFEQRARSLSLSIPLSVSHTRSFSFAASPFRRRRRFVRNIL